MNLSVKGAALVTGSAVRLGKHIALALAADGYDIALHFNSSLKKAEATAQEIRALGVACEAFQFNLKEAENILNFVQKVKHRFPNLNTLINSASGYEQKTIRETTVATFDNQFALNLRAPFFMTQAFAKTVESGNVINILDNKIGFNQYNYAAYLLSKKAFAEFTRMAALEFAPNIRINGVAPGVVLPATTRSQEYIDWRIQGIPLQMQGQTAHITQAILSFLQNDFITGQIMVVDGGENIAHIGQNAGDFDQSKV